MISSLIPNYFCSHDCDQSELRYIVGVGRALEEVTGPMVVVQATSAVTNFSVSVPTPDLHINDYLPNVDPRYVDT